MIKSQSGFTLIETLISLFIMAILLGSAGAAYQTLFVKNREQQLLDQLWATLQFARVSAVTYGETITVCPSRDQLQCGGEWRDGLIVILRSGQVLRKLPALKEQELIVWRGNFGRNDNLRYVASGFTQGQVGTFSLCLPGSDSSKGIVVQQSGRLRIGSKTSCV